MNNIGCLTEFSSRDSNMNVTGRRLFTTGIGRIQLFVIALCFGCSVAFSQSLTVAAAADLQPPLTEVSALFKAQMGIETRVTYGASGNLYAQIVNGAPYDVFLSADIDYPKSLVKNGNAGADSFTPFARGSLALFIAVPLGDVNSARGTIKPLFLPTIRRIAIANPKHAPYGRAAEELLRKAGALDSLRSKLVFGENVRQAFEFAQSGNAEAALVSRSLAQIGSHPGAVWWELPIESYPPLDQAAVITSHGASNANARKFLDFLRTPQAKAVFERHGFRRPSTETSEGAK